MHMYTRSTFLDFIYFYICYKVHRLAIFSCNLPKYSIFMQKLLFHILYEKKKKVIRAKSIQRAFRNNTVQTFQHDR